MSKVTVVGAGNVGATVANVLAHRDIVKEIVLLDIQGNMPRGATTLTLALIGCGEAPEKRRVVRQTAKKGRNRRIRHRSHHRWGSPQTRYEPR